MSGAGVRGALFHDRFRSAMEIMEAAGVSRRVTMKSVCHKTRSICRRYAIADKAAQEDGTAKLADQLSGQPAKRKTVPIAQQA